MKIVELKAGLLDLRCKVFLFNETLRCEVYVAVGFVVLIIIYSLKSLIVVVLMVTLEMR